MALMASALKQFEFLRFALPRTLYKMVKKDSFGSHKRLGFPWITEHYFEKHYRTGMVGISQSCLMAWS
jgi:hypothetical protein